MRDAAIELINFEIEGGFDPGTKTGRRRVYAAVLSVARSEFYLANQTGMKADIVFEVHVAEYAEENRVEYKGKRYQVMRTYNKRNKEFMELVCNDLRELAKNAGEVAAWV